MGKPKKKAKPDVRSRNAKDSRKQTRREVERVLTSGAIRKRPRQQRLPGVEEDPGSKRIDNAAYEYVEARDAMQASVAELVKREQKLLAIVAAERPGKLAYKHNVGTETITVRIVAKDPTRKAKVTIKPVEEETKAKRTKKDVTPEPEPEPAGDVHAMDAQTGSDGSADVSVN